MLHLSRAEFVVTLTADIQRRLVVEAPALNHARAVLEAETMMFEEEDQSAGRDRIGRGGRRPMARLFNLDDVARVHELVRRQRGSGALLNELLAGDSEGEDAGG